MTEIKEIRWPWLLVLFCATALLFSPSIRFEFLNWDDPLLLTEQYWFLPLTWKSFFQFLSPASFWQGKVVEYYPVRDSSYAFDLLFWGWNAHGFHVTQIIIHSFNAVLFAVLAGFFVSRRYAFLAAALWAWHPLVVEPVAWISARKDLLLGTFFILSAIALYKGKLRTAAALSLGTLLSKITAVAVGLLPLSPELAKAPRSTRLRQAAFLILAGAGFTVFRTLADVRHGIVTLPADGQTFFSHWPAAIQSVTHAVLMMAWPTQLSARYAQDFDLGWTSLRVWAGLVFSGSWIAGIFYTRRRIPTASVGLFFALVAFLPHLPILPTNIWMADRYLYLTLAGFCLTVAALVEELDRKGFRGGAHLLLAISLILAVGSWRRLPVWKDSLSLWIDTSEKSPGVYYVWENLGSAQLEKGLFDKATESFQKALALNDSNHLAWLQIAQIQAKTNHPSQAVETLAKFEQTATPQERSENLRNLGIVFAAIGQTDHAELLLKQHLKIRPQDPLAWANLGVIYASTQRESLALQAWNRALTQNPVEKTARFNRAKFYFFHNACVSMSKDLSAIDLWIESETIERNTMLRRCGAKPDRR